MKLIRTPFHHWLAAALGMAAQFSITQAALATDVLVADRLTNSVYRYSETGVLIDTVVADGVNIDQAVGLALSPDLTNLYVSSFQDGWVVRYDYDYDSGKATNPMIFASGLQAPNAILFSEDGETIYVSNLGGNTSEESLGVSRFHTDGSSAGTPLKFPSPAMPDDPDFFKYSGLAFAPNGNLLVGAWKDSTDFNSGAVLKWNGVGSTLEFLVQRNTSLDGASGLLVHEDHVYVTGMFAGSLQRFNLTDGQRDPTFNPPGVPFPQGLMDAPDGDGFLAGILGVVGQSYIAHYDFNGNSIGVFASNSVEGFAEATALIAVPERLPGDFNNNGLVDSVDYAVWRNTLGTSYHLYGNGDETGPSRHVVDRADYQLWKNNYGNTAGESLLGSVSSQVPEPASLVLAVVLGIGYLVCGRRRRTMGDDRIS
jgi:sugar lactone lactonase YvrE